MAYYASLRHLRHFFPKLQALQEVDQSRPSGTSGCIDLGSSLSAMLFVVVGYLTLCANLKLFIDYWSERQPGTQWDRNHSNMQQLLTRFFLVVFFVPLVPGVFLYPYFAIKIHISVEPEPPTRKSQGFPSSIVMQVINSDQALLYPPISNNVAVTSRHSTFGLKLLLTIVPLGRDMDFQLTTSRSLTTSNLFLMLCSEFVFIQLAEKTYEFGYTESRLETSKGNFSDDSFSDLAFPSLGIPLHSTLEMRGSRSSDKRLYVELVDESSLVGTVLKTLEYLPKNMPCTELRMCGMWAMGEMIEDPKKIEAMLVLLGRIMIEMAKYGLARYGVVFFFYVVF